GTGTPINPEKYITDLAEAMRVAVSDPARAQEMGVAARERARVHFDWMAIADQTRAIYNLVTG
ncbi:MAG: glycogen synthase, partial [Aurantimicrobium sp.]